MKDSWRDDFPSLQERLAGPSFLAETPGFDDEVAVFNEALRHHPAVVVGAAGAQT